MNVDWLHHCYKSFILTFIRIKLQLGYKKNNFEFHFNANWRIRLSIFKIFPRCPTSFSIREITYKNEHVKTLKVKAYAYNSVTSAKISNLMLTRRWNVWRAKRARTMSRRLIGRLIEKFIDHFRQEVTKASVSESNHGTPIFNACAIHNRDCSLSMFPFSEWWFCISRMLIWRSVC